MNNILSYRNWSLLVVMPAIGIFVLTLNCPILYGFNIGAGESGILTLYQDVIRKFFGPNSNYNYIIMSVLFYFIGFVIQGISTTFWEIYSATSDCVKCPEDKQHWFICNIMKQLLNINKRHYSLTMPCFMEECNVSIKNVKTLFSTKRNEDHAGYQFYLEDHRTYASYIEWEKFLTSIYEYMIIVFIVSAPIHIVYWIMTIKAENKFIDWPLIWFCISSAIVIMFLWHASIVHRNAKRYAESKAYKIYSQKRYMSMEATSYFL